MTWYKPWTWFNGTGQTNDESEDSTYEDEVIERCDHDFEESVELLDTAALNEASIIGNYLVFPQYELVEEYCTKCGEPGLNGEPVPEPDYDYAGSVRRTGDRTRVAHTVAVELTKLDPGADPTEALSADYAVDEDGETTVIEGDGEGRVLVNESEQDD